jgi:hypothetical protein
VALGGSVRYSVPDWQIGTLIPETLYCAKLFPEFSSLSKRMVGLVESEPGALTGARLRDMSGKRVF